MTKITPEEILEMLDAKKFLSVKKSSHGKGRELKIDIAPLSFMYLEQVL